MIPYKWLKQYVFPILKKSPEILLCSPYYKVCFQFKQPCKHVNVISSSRDVQKSHHYAILDAQWIFNGQLKNIHCLGARCRAWRTIFHFSRRWYAYWLLVYTKNLWEYANVCLYMCGTWISNSAQLILASTNAIEQHYSSDNRHLRLNVCIENY